VGVELNLLGGMSELKKLYELICSFLFFIDEETILLNTKKMINNDTAIMVQRF
jgi:hypothetical protein